MATATDPTPTPDPTPPAPRETPVETPPTPPGGLDPTPAPAPPAGAKTVVEGQRTERELALERELDEERKGRKRAETDAAHLLDENRRLKEPKEPKESKPKKKAGSRWTFFDDEEG